jgi:hypothetical protein
MTLISTITGGGTSYTFTSIPQTATDLMLICSLRPSSGATTTGTLLLNLAGTTYSQVALSGDGTTATSTTAASNSFIIASNSSTGPLSNVQIYIPNYAVTVAKAISIDSVNEGNFVGALQNLYAALWTTTDAITSIRVSAGTAFNTNSTISLYSITKGSGGATVT